MKRDAFATRELAMAISSMGKELEHSYRGVSDAVTAFVNSFRRCDAALLVASMENFVAALKEGFDQADKVLYGLIRAPGSTVIVAQGRITKEENGK